MRVGRYLIRRRVPFTRPSFTQEQIRQIGQLTRVVLKSGRVTLGPYTRSFEERIARRAGTKFAVAVSSGTAAVHACMAALKIGSGDEVIVPADTFAATANAALYQGARPVFADVDPLTYDISVKDLQRKISPRTKAVVPVHLGGNPCDMKAIAEIAHDSKVAVIEDSAQALGSMHRGKPCGSFGAVGAFSFDHAKLVTCGEGGAVVTDSHVLATKVSSFRNVGRSELGPASVKSIGYNYRMSELNAIVGLVLEESLERFLGVRANARETYLRNLAKLSWIETQKIEEHAQSSNNYFLVRIGLVQSRDRIVAALQKEGIGTSVVYRPVHTQPAYRRVLGDLSGTCPVAEDLGANGMALPMFNSIQANQVERTVSALSRFG